MQAASPYLLTAKINELRPTQLTVAFVTVQGKMEKWKALHGSEREGYLSEHWLPTVIGPDGAYYIVDHHHLGVALLKSHVKHARLLLLKDLSSLRA
jgi:hypothetical protein